MPRNLDGSFDSTLIYDEGNYLKSPQIQTYLKDIENTINTFFTPSNKFSSTINCKQMINVSSLLSTNPNYLGSGVPFSQVNTRFLIPSGAIIEYDNKTYLINGIPDGFVICDGNNNTPNLTSSENSNLIYIKKI